MYGSVIGKQTPDKDRDNDLSARVAYEEGVAQQEDEQSSLLSADSVTTDVANPKGAAAILGGLKGRVGSTVFCVAVLCILLVATLELSGSVKSFFQYDKMKGYESLTNTIPVDETYEMQQNAITLADSSDPVSKSTVADAELHTAGHSFVWGVNQRDNIYYRAGVNGSWRQIDGKLVQLSVSDDGQHVWGVNKKNELFHRNGVGGSWKKKADYFRHVSVNSDGKHVWGVLTNGNVMHSTGPSSLFQLVDNGQQVNMISVSGDGNHIVGCRHEVYCPPGCHPDHPSWKYTCYYRTGVSGSWTSFDGEMYHVDINGDGTQYVGIRFGSIYRRDGRWGSWVKVDGSLSRISISANGKEIWGVNQWKNIYWRPSLSSGSWNKIGGDLTYVDVGMK